MSIENTPRTTTVQPEQNAPALVRKIGKTTYKVRVHFSTTSTETMQPQSRDCMPSPWVGLPPPVTSSTARIVPTIAIPHPLGNPALTMEEEKHIRRKILETALTALSTEVDDQTIFEVKY